LFLRKPCSWRADNFISDFARAVRAQFVRHQHIGREALLLEQIAHQSHGCGLVPSSLQQQVENLAFIINCAPKPKPPARNYHRHLVDNIRKARWRAALDINLVLEMPALV